MNVWFGSLAAAAASGTCIRSALRALAAFDAQSRLDRTFDFYHTKVVLILTPAAPFVVELVCMLFAVRQAWSGIFGC